MDRADGPFGASGGRCRARTVRLLAALVWQVRVAWGRSGGRARVAALLIGLILLAAETRSILPSISHVAQAVAVLVVAGIGFWMIPTSPIRRRRW
jgi:hypothetical protein